MQGHRESIAFNLADRADDSNRLIRVLLVENNSGDALLVQLLLEESHPGRFEIHPVSYFEEAVEAVKQFGFDAALLDLGLPDLEGADAVFELQRYAPALPIVVLSGRTDEALAMRLVEAGAQDYLVKGQVEGNRIARALVYGMKRKAAGRALEHLALSDGLTGLPNRASFEQRLASALARARRHHKSLAVMFLDLDKFKTVNDQFGHRAGDTLLCAAARRLSECVREVDMVSRIGGDEFTVLLEDLDSSAGACVVAQKIIDAFAQPVCLAESKLCISTSIGIAVHPDAGSDAGELIRNADAAMYVAKKNGRGGYHLHSHVADDVALVLAGQQQLLRRGIENGELEIHYQPQVSVFGNNITGLEALVRWRPPGAASLILPAELLPLAEKFGLTPSLDEWVTRTACRQQKSWIDAGLAVSRVAVNMSAVHLGSGHLADVVGRVLRDTGLAAAQLEIEIAQVNFMHDLEAAHDELDSLRANGVHVAVDGFGVGQCPWSDLRNIPADTLKMDRSFAAGIADPLNATITGAMISLAKALGLRIVAHGVETQDQFNRLRLMGAKEFQGFLIAKPAGSLEITNFLKGAPQSVALPL